MELSFHVHYKCRAKTINKWWRGSGCICGLSPLSGIIWEIVNSVGQGNLTFLEKRQGLKPGNFKKPLAVTTMN